MAPWPPTSVSLSSVVDQGPSIAEGELVLPTGGWETGDQSSNWKAAKTTAYTPMARIIAPANAQVNNLPFKIFRSK